MTQTGESQATSSVLMIRPVRFQSNPETAASNRFQQQDHFGADEDTHANALAEFDNLVATLEAAGVEVIVVDDTLEPHTPDSIFPNNWLSLHADATAVLYPMMAGNRRSERRMDILQTLSEEHHYRIDQTIDLSSHEADEKFLEGTGSIVLDRENRIAYACLSPRTDLEVLQEFSQRLNYELVAFAASGEDGTPVYHTNVMMSVGRDYAVICADCIKESQRQAVLDKLSGSGHEIIAIDYSQMASFAGNMLELNSKTGGRILAMSSRALKSLTPGQRHVLAGRVHIVASPIDTIEKSSGGSVRCMLAEIHLPRKQESSQ